MLSQLNHRNLAKLIGICIEDHTRCLVYELVSNGSVETHLVVFSYSLSALFFIKISQLMLAWCFSHCQEKGPSWLGCSEEDCSWCSERAGIPS